MDILWVDTSGQSLATKPPSRQPKMCVSKGNPRKNILNDSGVGMFFSNLPRYAG